MTEYTALANYQAVKNEDLIVVKQCACGTLLEVKDANQLCESKPSGQFTPVMACIRCVQQLAQFHSHHSVKTINICSTVYSPRARLLSLSLSLSFNSPFCHVYWSTVWFKKPDPSRFSNNLNKRWPVSIIFGRDNLRPQNYKH